MLATGLNFLGLSLGFGSAGHRLDQLQLAAEYIIPKVLMVSEDADTVVLMVVRESGAWDEELGSEPELGHSGSRS